MLVLYETPLGFCLFKVTDAGKLDNADLWKEFETPEQASSLLKLRALHRFTSTASAVEDITALQEGKMSKSLKKFLVAEVVEKGKGKETLAVIDSKLAGSISKKLGIKVVADSTTLDLYRGIRSQLAALLDGLNPDDLSTMSLGLSHSLSRFKLKFSPDKVDTMVIQAIALLDDLDKEINIYAMRVKEWYGWHFPEMAKILVDNVAYAKVVRAMGFRTNAATTSLASLLPEDLDATIKAAAEISMGTEISDSDIAHIHQLCDQVISISAYRAQLSEYLRNRMTAIAPNLTALVGELVGARLISHAGSLLQLAKHPASTVQILGAEKALFRALKTKHDTPKYGLIYHASLVGQAPPKLKGKMARMVATKTALSVRVDALADADTKSESDAASIGIEAKAKLESRLRALEAEGDLGAARRYGEPGGSTARKTQRVSMSGDAARSYNPAADVVSGSDDLVPTQRGPLESAMQAVLDVKEEKKRRKEEKRRKREEQNEDAMEVDEEPKDVKKKRREAEAAAAAADVRALPTDTAEDREETAEERAERKRLRKEKKAAKLALTADSADEKAAKKRRASEGGSGSRRRRRKSTKATLIERPYMSWISVVLGPSCQTVLCYASIFSEIMCNASTAK
ncbi:Nop-domain-containing protein [Auriculariales sp. MPI-PUGE-AT-0066]|nr:Nop-domain-containing protein [Auriculariales sp. MPI-PUGE-AT-0066]